MPEGTSIKVADGNGLAVMVFGLTSWIIALIFLRIDALGFNDANNVDKNAGAAAAFGTHAGSHNAFAALGLLLKWTTMCGLFIAGVLQALSGDSLGTTSYMLHSVSLGAFGYGLSTAQMVAWGYVFYALFYFNVCFAVSAFSNVNPGKSWGILYVLLSLMFLTLGLRFTEALYDESNHGMYGEKEKVTHEDVKYEFKKYDGTGDIIAGIFSLFTCLWCMFLVWPLVAGKGKMF
jgi:magnesium-transporting ATPase (P-type)